MKIKTKLVLSYALLGCMILTISLGSFIASENRLKNTIGENPLVSAADALKQVKRITAIFSVFAVAIVPIFSLAASRKISNELAQLKKNIKKMEKGGFKSDREDDEISEIEQEFKNMADRLKQKIKELEKINRITIGRELRMIELKNKMTDYERKQKQRRGY